MSTRWGAWLEDRARLTTFWRWFADEPVPGGARLRYVFGSVLVYLFMQQVVLGILLATYYSPSASDAWASTAYLNDQIEAGWFLRGLHSYGSSAMVIVLVLHALQVIVSGAYRRPRELTWLTGLGMGAIVLAFAFTGYLLPWDQKGYWATQVATSIIGNIPLGESIQHFLQGGAEYGNLTLTRFFAIHVFVLPFGLGGLLVAHLALFRVHGVTPPIRPTDAELQRKSQPFVPYQLFIDVCAMVLTGAVLVFVTFSTHGAELFAPAQPSSNFVARPEWYFLSLFQLLHYLRGPLQLVGTVVIPGSIAIFLLALPWVDRARERGLRHRWPILVVVGGLFSGVIALTAVSMVADANDELYQKGLAEAQAQAEEARRLALAGISPMGGAAVFENDPRFHARQLFERNCQACHEISGVGGGAEGPSLAGYASRDWLAGMIRNPKADQYFGLSKHDEMDAYPTKSLSDADLRALVEYLMSHGVADGGPVDAELAARGKAVFEDDQNCSMCHEVEPGESGGGPNLHEYATRAWVTRVIEDPSQADLYGPSAQMPKYVDKLEKQEIELLAEFIVGQRTPAE